MSTNPTTYRIESKTLRMMNASRRLVPPGARSRPHLRERIGRSWRPSRAQMRSIAGASPVEVIEHDESGAEEHDAGAEDVEIHHRPDLSSPDGARALDRRTITTRSGGAMHTAMPIQKPKSSFVNAIGSEASGCLLVAVMNVPAFIRLLVGHGRDSLNRGFPLRRDYERHPALAIKPRREPSAYSSHSVSARGHDRVLAHARAIPQSPILSSRASGPRPLARLQFELTRARVRSPAGL